MVAVGVSLMKCLVLKLSMANTVMVAFTITGMGIEASENCEN